MQWSTQTQAVTNERQQRYKASGVCGCWFFKTPPIQYRSNRDLPLFRLEMTEAASTVIFNPYGYDAWLESSNRRIPLPDFVTALLTSKIRWCEKLQSQRQQKVRIVFVEIECWKCHQPYHVYYMHDLQTSCGETMDVSDSTWENGKYYFAPQILSVVREFTHSPDGQHLKLGSIKKRYSKTVEHEYMSFGCPHCDAICGDFFLHHEIIPEMIYVEDKAAAILEKEISLSAMLSEESGHWCFPENGQFCCG